MECLHFIECLQSVLGCLHYVMKRLAFYYEMVALCLGKLAFLLAQRLVFCTELLAICSGMLAFRYGMLAC